MSGNWIFEGARVVDPARGVDQTMDIGVQDGALAPPEKVRNPTRASLSGLVLCPGFIDLHTHLRQPGGTAQETIRTGTMAAAAGGYTTVVCMPNTFPPADNAGTIEYIKRHAETEGVVRVLPTGCMTKRHAGEEMCGIGGLKKSGVVALTDDGRCVRNNDLMLHIVTYAKSFKLPILDHCEDSAMSEGGQIHDGYWSMLTGLKGIPSAAEEIIVSRNIILSEAADWGIHIQHISSKGSVALVRAARARGVKVTAEATPHHIALTDERVKDFDACYKMNPPLRSEEDRKAILEGLRDGTISVIATDHAPHTEMDKLNVFDEAPFGVVGLETAVCVCLDELYHKGILDLPSFVSKFTSGPAKVLGLEIGTLTEGTPADLTALDLNAQFEVVPSKFKSRSRNTPFAGMRLRGAPVLTVVGGTVVFSAIPQLPASVR